MTRSRNTYKEGSLTFIGYATSNKTYVMACEELCLLVEGKDPELLKLNLIANAKSYIESVAENDLGEDLLNQNLPDEISDEFMAIVND